MKKKQSQSLATPMGSMSTGGTTGKSIFNDFNICRRCQLKYPKTETRCDCGKQLAYKPRSKKKNGVHRI